MVLGLAVADTSIFALTTRGLESVTVREMATVPGLMVTGTAYRRVAARCVGSLRPLLAIRTADDVYLDLGSWTDIDHRRSELAVFTARTAALDLETARRQIQDIRRIARTPVFSVTASFVGKRNYSADEIKTAVAQGVNARYGWIYTPDDRAADLNLRLFIEHQAAHVGVRLAAHALHERDYKTAQIAGSLKPSVAAALVMLAEAHGGSRLLDPFCGAGTIVIEAAQLDCEAWGGDFNSEALAAARSNTERGQIMAWDARKLPLRAEAFDCVVSNLPWGRQVAVDHSLTLLYRQALMEMRRVLKPDALAVLLTSSPELLEGDSFSVIQQIEISLFGQKPTISVLRRL